jgi:hypothetical protein
MVFTALRFIASNDYVWMDRSTKLLRKIGLSPNRKSTIENSFGFLF